MPPASRVPSQRRGPREPTRVPGIWLVSCRECGRLHEPSDSMLVSSLCPRCTEAERPAGGSARTTR